MCEKDDSDQPANLSFPCFYIAYELWRDKILQSDMHPVKTQTSPHICQVLSVLLLAVGMDP